MISPELGGSILRYVFRGRDVLRPAAEDVRDPLETACFSLVPFANRIAQGAFVWNGRTIRLPRNFGDHPHVLHGHGWQAMWRVISHIGPHALLRYEHAAGDWPWTYVAEQSFDLVDGALHAALSVRSASGEPMPASLGFHPYFPRQAGTRLTTQVQGVWLSNDSCIPTRLAGPAHFFDLANGAAMAPLVDHCHTGWNGEALIEQEGLRVHLSAPNCTFLHIYAPVDGDCFCAEPVTAMPDAMNRPREISGLRALAAGETFSIRMVIAPQA